MRCTTSDSIRATSSARTAGVFRSSGMVSSLASCSVCFPGAYAVSLVPTNNPRLDTMRELGKTPAVRALDVARIESLVVQRILGAGTATPSLAYTPDPHAAFDAVRNGRAAAAVLLNPTKVRDVFAVADAGDVMPPKSTYFVPKVPSGLVMRPV